MSLVPLELLPGMYRNGTPYDAKNRYNDGNLIRWHDGAMRAVGGWERRAVSGSGADIPPIVSDPDTETVRDMISFRDNAGALWTVFGTNSGLYSMTSGGVLADITPVGFVGGANDITFDIGYGTSVYGSRTYGTARNPEDAAPIAIDRWTFDMWGENVICTYEDGWIYEYVPGAANAVVLANAPTNVQSAIVTGERIVMAINNSAPDIRTVEWSDRENNTEWTPTTTNYAGSYPLSGTGLAVGIYKIQKEILILTETDAHIGTYLGAPYVYGFQAIGDQCGPIHHKAVIATERFIMWLGLRNFWIYDGTLQPVHCEVMDFIASDLDRTMISKMWCTTISTYGEVWWFYQSHGGTEVDSYVIYDYFDNTWSTGRLNRTAGYDRGALNSPVMVDELSQIWNHEQQAIIPDGRMFSKTGPIEVGYGEALMAVRMLFPDTQFEGDVEVGFYTRQFPTDPDRYFGPYTYANPISTTGVLGREVRLEFEGLTNSWEVGSKMRLDIQPVAEKGYPTR